MGVGWRALPRLLVSRGLYTERITHRPTRSLFVRHIDGGSSNLAEAELTSLIGPVYNLARYGVRFVASPSHADVLLLTGPLTRNMVGPAHAAFEVMPEPKAIVTVGDYWPGAKPVPASDEVSKQQVAAAFGGSYAIVDLPPDMRRAVLGHVAGDPPEPQELIEALLQAAKERPRRHR